MSINLEDLYAEAQEASQKVSGSSTKNPKVLNCNRTTTVYFKLTPSYDVDGKPKLLKPFGSYNFKISKNGRRYYAGTAPSSLDLPDVIVDKRNEHFNNGEKEIGGRMYAEPRALYSIYVISDSENPDNDKKFMLMNTGNKEKSDYGKGSPFKNFIEDAMSDPDDPKSLNDIYSMGSSDLRIRMDIEKADKNSIPDISYKWVSNSNGNPFSKFDDIGKFFKENALDLDQEVEAPKSDEELLKLYKTHILGVTTENVTTVDTPAIPNLLDEVKDEVDEINLSDSDFKNLDTSDSDDDDSDEIKNLLSEIPDL